MYPKGAYFVQQKRVFSLPTDFFELNSSFSEVLANGP
jgi:hypothetical protein